MVLRIEVTVERNLQKMLQREKTPAFTHLTGTTGNPQLPYAIARIKGIGANGGKSGSNQAPASMIRPGDASLVVSERYSSIGRSDSFAEEVPPHFTWQKG
jgi:hypothetical protein